MPINATRNILDITAKNEPIPASAATARAPKADITKLPVSSISDFLTLELIEKHLDSLSSDQLAQLYSRFLPESCSKNPLKSDVLDVVRSGFFQQATSKLSELLREGNGAGYLLAQSLKYNYQGEGVEGFLNGVRELGRKENEDRDDSADDDTQMKD